MIMRIVVLLSAAAFVAASSADTRSRVPMRGVHHAPPCGVGPDATNRCSNLLDEGWSKQKNDSPKVSELLEKLNRLVRSPHQSAASERRSSWECKWGKEKPTKVAFQSVIAMDSFPVKIVGSEFVAGVFIVTDDEGCWEAEYGVRKQTDDWTRESQFLTVRLTRPFDDANPPTANETFGRMTTWAISSKPGPDGSKVFRLEKLEAGNFVRCGRPHEASQWSGFYGCLAVQAATDSLDAWRRANPRGDDSVSLDAFLTHYFAIGDRTYRGKKIALPAESFTGPGVSKQALFDGLTKVLSVRDYNENLAWMQCGAMGCCTADN
jgi:hypothetical protein